MRKFRVSRATIHRDVAELAKRDAISVVRGGVIWNDNDRPLPSTTGYAERVVTNRAAKIKVAGTALELIVDGDIIFLDSSTTVYELSLLLKNSKITHLTIITNSLAVMQNFRKLPQCWAMIGLGGGYDAQLNSILGSTALEQLRHLNITKAFVSAFGLDTKNATTNHERQAELLRAVIAASDKSYLLVDKSKLSRNGIHHLASRSAFSRIITD